MMPDVSEEVKREYERVTGLPWVKKDAPPQPMPQRVQIGPYAYAVVSDALSHDRYESTARVGCYGAIRYTEHRILIDPHAHIERQRVALFHEVIHGCDDLAGTNGIEEEEQIITALAPLLLDTLRRNPALVAYLTEEDA